MEPAVPLVLLFALLGAHALPQQQRTSGILLHAVTEAREALASGGNLVEASDTPL